MCTGDHYQFGIGRGMYATPHSPVPGDLVRLVRGIGSWSGPLVFHPGVGSGAEMA